jgi:hypothetical protein
MMYVFSVFVGVFRVEGLVSEAKKRDRNWILGIGIGIGDSAN